MWLFVPEGYFSIVTADEFGHELQIRTRSKDDLERLRETYLPSLGEPVSLPDRDYPWRAFTTREALSECLTKAVDTLDYDNFKDTVARRLSPARARTYHRVWEACTEIQREERSGPNG